VTYTLTFTNVGTNPKAAAVPVDEIDYMKDVLDDATLTSGPTASDAALVAKTTGDTIQVTGALASGQVARVTYTVKVKAYNDQGNHQIGNVVARNGDEPICVPDSQLCTMHKVTPPVPGLADTGSDVTTAGLLAALLAGLGGIGLLITRWRRRRLN
jgi:LPXTG-motif cell wall-anchored protein